MTEQHSAPGLIMGYARVSTEDQNLALQMEAMVKAGVERERIYTDKASGATTKRPGFVAVLKALRAGDTLVIWKLDRLGRNLSQLLQTADYLKEHGIQLRVLTEAIDTSTPMGRFMFNVMGSFAQLEREMGQERTRAGLLLAKERGQKLGAKRRMTSEMVEAARMMMATVADGGQGMTALAVCRKLKIGKTTLYRELAATTQEKGADDLKAA